MGRQSNWDQEEDQILLKVLKQEKSKKWKKVSIKLKEKKYYRTPSECRERFINYLMKDIDKSQIRDSELEVLYEKYDEVGAKWSFIQSFLTSRTQCKLKNIFYGNIINILKTTYKYFTQKTAFFINSLSTQQLISIYNGTGIFEGIKIAKIGIKAMKYRNNKAIIYSNIIENQDAYLQLMNTILVEIFKQKPLKKMVTIEKTSRLIEKYQTRYQKRQSNEGSICKQQFLDNNVKFQPSHFLQQQQNIQQLSLLQSGDQSQEIKQKDKFLIKKQEKFHQTFLNHQNALNLNPNQKNEEALIEFYKKINYRPFIDPLFQGYHFPFFSSFCSYPPYKN